jgi:1-deoxy-D-xylulose-5-phosphate reductoisomerase
MKTVSILGSTGSIGRNAVEVVKAFPERFRVKAIAAGANTALLAKQIESLKPEVAAVLDEERAVDLRGMISSGASVEIVWGLEGYIRIATTPADILLSAVVGAAGLLPAIAAIDAGIDIALANKETLVMAGEIVIGRAAERGVRIIPVDSEHSAIFQCLSGQRPDDLRKIILTASGGPFLRKPETELGAVTPEEALRHPTWRMGPKISVDSATLMNKGLELIEAKHLFGVQADQIEILVHPQSVVHSMVSLCDGSVIAQLGVPDMKLAIAYALSYPSRLDLGRPAPDFARLGALTFEAPDRGKFPCLDLACRAIQTGGTLPAVLNAANEMAVEAFLTRKIDFNAIPEIIRDTMDRHAAVLRPELPDILAADRWAREVSGKMLTAINGKADNF